MNLEARKISFVHEFLRIQNEEIIDSLEKFLKSRKAELVDNTFKPMNIEEYNNEIDKAIDDSESGRMIKATDLKAKIQK